MLIYNDKKTIFCYSLSNNNNKILDFVNENKLKLKVNKLIIDKDLFLYQYSITPLKQIDIDKYNLLLTFKKYPVIDKNFFIIIMFLEEIESISKSHIVSRNNNSFQIKINESGFIINKNFEYNSFMKEYLSFIRKFTLKKDNFYIENLLKILESTKILTTKEQSVLNNIWNSLKNEKSIFKVNEEQKTLGEIFDIYAYWDLTHSNDSNLKNILKFKQIDQCSATKHFYEDDLLYYLNKTTDFLFVLENKILYHFTNNTKFYVNILESKK